MAIYRVKVPRCVDIVIEASGPDEVLSGLRDLVELCGGGKIYVHLLVRRGGELVEERLVYAGTL